MKTQEQAILDALLGGVVITGSNAYAITKKECNCGTLNLHKVLAKIRKKGYTINEELLICTKYWLKSEKKVIPLMSAGNRIRRQKQCIKNSQ